MTGTNRNRKVPLSEAWQHYWSVLFPGGRGWQSDLEAEIRKRLYFPGGVDAFHSGSAPDLRAPNWAEELALTIEDSHMSAKFGKLQLGPVPLFVDSHYMTSGNWKTENPFERTGSLLRNIEVRCP